MKKKLLSSLLVMSLLATSSLTAKAQTKAEMLLQGMNLEQKIQQMLMPDFRLWAKEGETKATDLTVLNEEVAQIVDKYDFGGVILFANNVKTTEQTLKLTEDYQKAVTKNLAGNGKIPLLLTIDQEGGIVYRLGSGTALPGNMAIGATGSEEYAKKAGQVIGRELSSLGVNVNFSPVMDVNNNPNNPVIGLRSFSDSPQIVAKLGTSMMKGIQEYNVATAAKHFPGHGDVEVDSHVGLGSVDKSLDELMKMELLPFQAVMDQGVDMVMTAHIQFPQIDNEEVVAKDGKTKIFMPATLSKKVLTDLVRTKMHYNGIIVTDAMKMDAIAKYFTEEDAVVHSIKAGVDIVLMPTVLQKKSDMVKIDNIIMAVKKAVESGEITEERLNTSVLRILNLKEKRKILDYEQDKRTFDEKLAVAKKEVGSKFNRDIEREISEAAVTVTKNVDGILPLKPKPNEKVLLLGAYKNEIPGMELSMRRLKSEGVISNKVEYSSAIYTKLNNIDGLKAKIDESDHIVLISEVGNASQMKETSWLTKIPHQILAYAKEKGKKAVVMSISKPYDVTNYDDAKGVVTVYGSKGMDPTEKLAPDNAFGPNIPAGVEVIFGGADARGKLPVAIPKFNGSKFTDEIVYARGTGITYKKVVTDKSELEKAIKEAELITKRNRYTKEKLAILDQKLPIAKNVFGTPNISQDEVDKIKNELLDAIRNLEYRLPTIISGNNQTYVLKSGKNLIIKSDGYFEDLVEVKVDDKKLEKETFVASSGSTIIEVKSAFLDTLKEGKHKIEIISVNGSAKAEFKVVAPKEVKDKGSKKSIKTGDTSFTGLIYLLTVSLFGLILILKKKIKV